ncbi:HK97 gp10 family phage protein [Vallitalea sp.]|jgi:hypothetical protein|uniref:HK97 gp10 family phage protein n=1 Tax=Vallitalea sp. TaxID=1882829 RepID=UPI0025E82522|nr:HK97 gp10 family phage protein [Vallitalea sp.]MCT4686080.1 HK97 gp10 family phage protein [Vallitalea sp.]
MAKKWGKFDYKSFEKMAKKFEKANKISDKVMIAILYELGNRALRKTKKRTPTGVYKDHTGGTLKKNWYITDARRKGNNLEIEIYNPTEYGPFVEYGHRKRNNKGWVEGKFMLTISLKEVEALIPKIADKHIQKALKELFKDD